MSMSYEDAKRDVNSINNTPRGNERFGKDTDSPPRSEQIQKWRRNNRPQPDEDSGETSVQGTSDAL